MLPVRAGSGRFGTFDDTSAKKRRNARRKQDKMKRKKRQGAMRSLPFRLHIFIVNE